MVIKIHGIAKIIQCDRKLENLFKEQEENSDKWETIEVFQGAHTHALTYDFTLCLFFIYGGSNYYYY